MLKTKVNHYTVRHTHSYFLKELNHGILSLILAVYKITFKLKETWKYQFTKIEKHQRDKP